MEVILNAMVIETELKFAIKPEALEALKQYLNHCVSQHLPAQPLMNSYYETDDNFLRRHDMGLRIRGVGENYEMTMKTAGQTIGGLHQRPEYNVDLKQPILELDKFPKTIWPDGCDIVELNRRLKPLFTTNFNREIWLITEGESVFELALDRGSIEGNNQVQALLEVELELKQGPVQSLFDFAFAFISNNQGAVRLSNSSKAERGYQLATNTLPETPRGLFSPVLPRKLSLEAAMQQLLSYLLTEWQYLDRAWLTGKRDDALNASTMLSSIRHLILQFGGAIPRKASHEIRCSLTQLEEYIRAEQPTAVDCCFHPQWVQAQLTLTQWLVFQQWQGFLNEKQRSLLSGSYKRWSDTQLSRIGATIHQLASQLSEVSHKLQLKQSLQQQLTLMQLLSSYYSAEAVDNWLSAWIPLLTANSADSQVLYHRARKLPDYWLSGKKQPR